MARRRGGDGGRDDQQQPPDLSRAIGELADATPILMFPVRIETRFTPSGEELMLRVYPDECLLDTFDPTLTTTEVTNAQAYWAAVWEAVDDEAAQRAALAALIRPQGAGRARWVVETYRPSNPAQQPTAPGTGVTPTFDPVVTTDLAWSTPA